ncbi:MAG: hypothetical protein O7G31_06555, partial [Calditrichaeota bacterium]|nr:hypothetical protein [Calditrichota bacterium]
SFLKWTGAFATSIDESSWFILLFLLELETYVLSDETLEGPTRWIILAIRIPCYIFLVHTLYAFGDTVYDLSQVTPIAGITELCQLVASNVSYVENLKYTLLDFNNCANLSSASQFFYTEPGLVVTDSNGLAVERHLAWLDLIEAFVWICILFTIGLMVWLQDRGITKGSLMRIIIIAKVALYSVLWGAAGYWIFKGHYYFAWDEFIWISGFFFIEMNVADWREEINEVDAAKLMSTT